MITKRGRTGRQTQGAHRASDTVFGYLIPLVLIGLAIADFAKDGTVDKYLIGAVLLVGLGALGYRVDTIIEGWLAARAGMAGQGPPPQEQLPPIDEGDRGVYRRRSDEDEERPIREGR